MRGYWAGFSYMGYLPDGKYHPFVSENEYKEIYSLIING